MIMEIKNKISSVLQWFKVSVNELIKEVKAFMSAASPEEAGYILKHSDDLRKQIAPALRFAFIIISIIFGFFIVWGGLAPLDSAVVAPGVLVVSSKSKTIQHLEGGVIEQIFVEDGQRVKAGEVLIKLNETLARSKLQTALGNLRNLKAIEARLLAEKYDEDKVVFEGEYFDRNVPEVEKIIRIQESLFETRHNAVKGRRDVLNQKILQYKEHVKGAEAQLNSLETQHKIAKDQLDSMKSLFKQGYAEKNKLQAAQNRVSELEGWLGKMRAEIASTKEGIAETEFEIINNENRYQNEINDELKETQARILHYQEELIAFKDILERTAIKSPVEGEVTGLQYHTVGGVIHPGGKIMEITPVDDRLVVEARVDPKDIESLTIGLKARVQLSAYKARLVPRVKGEVTYVSADRLHDERSGMSYYKVQVEIDKKEIERINYNIKLSPGMPADVFIVKGERTLLQYLLSPITDSFHRAFKEK